MAALNVALNGVVIDLYGRVISGPVKIVGELMYSDRGVGGGPLPPGQGGGGGGDGDHIWGGGNVPMPNPPIANVPGAPGYRPPGDHIWGGGNEPFPTPPIYIPPAVPPGLQPPTPPNPGDPTTSVPGNFPVQPITPPAYMVVQYPGIGPVVVAPPAPAS